MAKKLPKIMNQEQFEQIFKAEGDKETKIAMLLGFEAGMRISEIVGYRDKVPPLSVEQVESSSIRILSGKGGKDRIVPRPKRLNQTAVKMLPLKVSRRTLQRRVTALGKRIIGKEITFHTLRHGFGSHLADSGRPLHEIQMLMGHSRLDTTGIYLHANPSKAISGARDVF